MMKIFKRPALLIGVLGTLLTLLGSWGLYRVEVTQARKNFLQDVRTVAMDLRLELRLSFEALYGLYGMFMHSDQVTHDEFQRIASEILERHPEIVALEWLPRISAENLAEFERQMQEVYGDYRIWQRDRQQQPVSVGDRQYYYPIKYLYPFEPYRNLLGLDVGYGADRQRMLERATQVNTLYITDPIDLMRDGEPQQGFFALIPLFEEEPQDTVLQNTMPYGFVRGVFRVERLLQQLPYRPQAEHVRLILTDTDTTYGYETLYDSHPGEPFDAEEAFKVEVDPSVGRSWSLLAAPIDPAMFQRAALWIPVQIGLIGLIISWLLAAVIHLLQRRSEQVERIVERRTLELNQLNEKLATLSLTDELTGVANRRSFDQALQKEWRRAARHGTSLSVVLLDVDYFKGYNDSLGHQAGDKCLRMVAHRLQEELKRPDDLLARYGGEEFVLLLPHAEGNLKPFAERCRAAIEALQISNPASHYGVVTISLGLATAWPTPNVDSHQLVEIADKALYDAKRGGRNQFVSRTLENPQPEPETEFSFK